MLAAKVLPGSAEIEKIIEKIKKLPSSAQVQKDLAVEEKKLGYIKAYEAVESSDGTFTDFLVGWSEALRKAKGEATLPNDKKLLEDVLKELMGLQKVLGILPKDKKPMRAVLDELEPLPGASMLEMREGGDAPTERTVAEALSGALGKYSVQPGPSADSYGIILQSAKAATISFRKVDNGEYKYYYSPKVMRLVRRLAEDHERVKNAALDPIAKEVTAFITAANESWDNYLWGGYAQFPWEVVANSWLTTSTWDSPPNWQLVLAHPEVGMLTNAIDADWADVDVEAAVLVHMAGIIVYPNESRNWYLGASGTAAYTDDWGLGIGPTVHVGGTRYAKHLPSFSLGAYWFDFDEDGSLDSDPAIGITVDLWRAIDSKGPKGMLEGLIGQ